MSLLDVCPCRCAAQGAAAIDMRHAELPALTRATCRRVCISWARSRMTISSPAWRSATRLSFPILKSGNQPPGRSRRRSSSAAAIIASRTRTFLEFAAYHPDTIEFFDIGNHLELANRILARPQYAAAARTPALQRRDQQGGLSRRQQRARSRATPPVPTRADAAQPTSRKREADLARRRPGLGRARLEVGHDIDDDRLVGGERLGKRRRDVARLLDPDAAHAKAARQPR